MLSLGDKTELFVDDYLIEKSENIELDILRPERREVVFKIDTKIEGNVSAYHSVVTIPETGQVYLYYRTNHGFALAISDDGIHFERANDLRLYPEIKDIKNMVFRGMPADHNFAPVYDDNPDCPKEQKFKAIGFNGWPNAKLVAFSSPDGIHWKLMREEPIITEGMFDSLNTAFWDKSAGVYRCYSRYFKKTEEEKKIVKNLDNFAADVGKRAIQSCTSVDFLDWTKPVPNTYNGVEAPFHFYTNSIRTVPGAEHILVGFPMRFSDERKKVDEHVEGGVSDCVFISSRDGKEWTMRDSRPWIYPGIDKRQWTERNFQVSAGFVDKNDEFSFYVINSYHWDDEYIVRYTIPKHRFGYAYSKKGEFLTKPFILNGNVLTFNYNTSAIGTLTVNVVNENGEPVKNHCYEMYGNEIAHPIDLSDLKGEKLRLKIKLEDAFLYAISC